MSVKQFHPSIHQAITTPIQSYYISLDLVPDGVLVMHYSFMIHELSDS